MTKKILVMFEIDNACTGDDLHEALCKSLMEQDLAGLHVMMKKADCKDPVLDVQLQEVKPQKVKTSKEGYTIIINEDQRDSLVAALMALEEVCLSEYEARTRKLIEQVQALKPGKTDLTREVT